MKVLIYKGSYQTVKKSGVGRAVEHQLTALGMAGISCTDEFCSDYDVIHINTVFPGSLRMSRKAKKAGKKVIYYGHSTMEDFKNSFIGSNLLAPLFRRWISRCYASGDLIITPTAYSRRILSGYGLGRPVISMSNGIDLRAYRTEGWQREVFRKRYSLGSGKKAVMAVGHYMERKGILDFVELAAKLPQYEFFWFGYTDLWMVPGKVRRAVRTQLPNLHFPGYMEPELLRQAYAGCDLFLFPTKEETEGIVLLEAIASRIPVLTRDIPIYEEWLPENRLVYKARSLEEFSVKITDILEGKLPDLTEAAYEHIEQNDLPVIGGRLRQVYKELMKDVKEGAYYENINHDGLVPADGQRGGDIGFNTGKAVD